MEKKQESMSNWSCVTQLLENEQPITLGSDHSFLTHREPSQMLFSLNYYKFAAKMVGMGKKVLDIGCNEGLGSWVIAKECGFCMGIDGNPAAIESAKKNFPHPSVEFECRDFSSMPSAKWDAILALRGDLENESFQKIGDCLTDEGVAVIAKKALNHEAFQRELSPYFEHLFLFAATGELIHTCYSPPPNCYITLCCKPKRL